MKRLLVVLLVLVFAAPAMAADWNFYGSARMTLFYNTFDEDANPGTDIDGDGVVDRDPESDTDLSNDLQGNARIGAKVKTSDVVSGRFEYSSTPGLRLLYGTASFGAFSFIVGQDYTPIDTLYSGRVIDDDIGLLKEGSVYESRIPQLKIKIAGFQAALIKNSAGDTRQADNDVMIPKIELAYDMEMSAFSIGGFLGYQTYDAGPSDTQESVASYVLGVRSKINAGPAFINLVVGYAQNAGNYGILLRNGYASFKEGDEDATTIMGMLAVGAKLGSSLKIEVGVGTHQNSVNVGGEETTGDAMSYYINLPITLAEGVFIVPEFTVFDLGENDEGTTTTVNGQRTCFGAKFQIDF